MTSSARREAGKPPRRVLGRGLGVASACVVAALVVGCDQPSAPSAPPHLDLDSRRPAFAVAKSRARAWLDQLEVDPIDLLAHGVKGIKKVAEILDAYLGLLEHAKDPAEVDAIRRRVAEIARVTERPEYHDLGRLSEAQLTENAMSYLRAAWLLGELGVDTRAYRDRIAAAKPRLDAHLASRGPWQQAMFLEYYERFGLDPPPGVHAAPLSAGVIARRLPAAAYDDAAAYRLTHEVFVAFDYGGRREPTGLRAEDLAFARGVLPQLVRRYVASRSPDLVGELLSCMTYLGSHADPSYAQAVDFLLAVQNENGTWGEYEAHRPRWGRYLDPHAYLHTTLVALVSLLEAFEGDWAPSATPR